MIEIEPDDLSDGKIIALLDSHRQEMFKHSPPESVHALDASTMQHPNLSFYSATIRGQFAACGALKRHDASLAEIKSMKTCNEYLRQGIAHAMLSHLIERAKERGHARLCLETGTMDAFIPSRKLYARSGFLVCEPFADYIQDPHSVCMALNLRD